MPAQNLVIVNPHARVYEEMKKKNIKIPACLVLSVGSKGYSLLLAYSDTWKAKAKKTYSECSVITWYI